MTDSHYTLFAAALLTIAFFGLRKKVTVNTTDQSYFVGNKNKDSNGNTYFATPTNTQPNEVNITVAGQPFAELSEKYVPLFGFVGIAQGITLQ